MMSTMFSPVSHANGKCPSSAKKVIFSSHGNICIHSFHENRAKSIPYSFLAPFYRQNVPSPETKTPITRNRTHQKSLRKHKENLLHLSTFFSKPKPFRTQKHTIQPHNRLRPNVFDGLSVLHILYFQTNYIAASCLLISSAETIYYQFLIVWTTSYIGYPDQIRVRKGSVFTSQQFKYFADSAVIKIGL